MGRKLFAVICSYAARSLFILLAFTATFYAVGAERSYLPNSFETSPLWNALSIVLGFAAAFLGGWLCTRITRDFSVVYGLIGLIVVFGILEIARASNMTLSPEVRPPGVDLREVIGKSIMPLWLTFAAPVVEVIGALMGARLAAPRDSAAQKPPPSLH